MEQVKQLMLEKPTVNDVKRKMKFSGKVIKTSLAGALIEIGLDKPGMVHISQLRKEPTNRVDDVAKIGDEVDVWVRSINKKAGLVELTMIEPLALDWSEIKTGLVVKGDIVRLEKFGAFIEIGAERPGLAHISELTHDYIREISDAVKIGDKVEAQVLDVDRKKKKIKLSLKALQVDPSKVTFDEIEEEEEAEIPTAMELAIRKAMDGTDSPDEAGAKESEGTVSEVDHVENKISEREDILSRTLKNKVRTE